VDTIVRYHLRPLLLAREPSLSRRDIHRYFRDSGDAGVDTAILSLADHPPPDGAHLATVRQLLEAYFSRRFEVVSPRPLLSGAEIVGRFGLAPGPAVGELLRELQEAQAAGEVSTPFQAEEWLRAQLAKDKWQMGGVT
jgi:hypothetical protein